MDAVKNKHNTFASPFYWREYPERDIEYVRWYPCRLRALSATEMWQSRNPVVLYIHIPFCNNVCHCCIYNKYATQPDLVAQYLQALKGEITNYAARAHLRDSEIISGYIGGGTPAALSVEQLEDLLAHVFASFNLRRNDARFTFTIETTPLEMTPEKAAVLRNRGIDRISIGGQSFDRELLRRIGRVHTGQDIEKCVELVRKAGFDHVCVDLMYGLPGQTMPQWEETLKCFLALKADSIGLYPYLVLPTSKLALGIQTGAIPPCPDQETLDAMFDYGISVLLRNNYFAVTSNELGKETTGDGEAKWRDYGVEVYDIGPPGYRGVIVSTFPRTTHIAHSWYEGGDLLAVGAGAYGYMNDYWYLNEPDVHAYVRAVAKGALPIVAGSPIPAEERVARFMVMGSKFLKLLRRDFVARFGVDLVQVFGPTIRQLQDRGLVELRDDSIRVTYPKGWYYIDNISKAFYSPANRLMPQFTLTNTNILPYLRRERQPNA